MNNDLKYYMSLPYTVVLRRDEDGVVIASIAELEGCVAHGDDEAGAIKELREMQSVCLQVYLDRGATIPLPRRDEELPSGKWLQRVPRSLHLRAIQLAEQEGCSLNQLVATVLAEAVGHKRAESTRGVDPVTASEMPFDPILLPSTVSDGLSPAP